MEKTHRPVRLALLVPALLLVIVVPDESEAVLEDEVEVEEPDELGADEAELLEALLLLKLDSITLDEDACCPMLENNIELWPSV